MRRIGDGVDHYGVELVKAPAFHRKRNSGTAGPQQELPNNQAGKSLADTNTSQHHKRMSLA